MTTVVFGCVLAYAGDTILPVMALFGRALVFVAKIHLNFYVIFRTKSPLLTK